MNPYESTDMACWQDPIGLETICTIVKTLTPTWNDGLHPVQLELVSTILDGQDILCCTATGDGKSLKLVRQLLFVTFLRLPQSRKLGLGLMIHQLEYQRESLEVIVTWWVMILGDQGTIEGRSWVWKTGEVWSVEEFLALQQQMFSCSIEHFGHFLPFRSIFKWYLIYICNDREQCKGINVSRIQGSTAILTWRGFKVRRLHNNFLTQFRGHDMHRTRQEPGPTNM